MADWNVNEAFWSTAAPSVKLAFKLIGLFVQKIKEKKEKYSLQSIDLFAELRDTNSFVFAASDWFHAPCCIQVLTWS